MLDTSQFTDAIILDESLATELHARLVTAVHKAISDGAVLGVDWPEFVSGKRFGRIMRVFGSPDDLAAYKALAKPLEQHRLVMLYGPQKTPDAAVWRSFFRCRKSEDGTDASNAYKQRRAAARGAVYTPPKAVRIVAKDYLKMVSTTTKQRFSLFIRLNTSDSPPVAAAPPSGYGMGGYVPHFGGNDE